MTVWMLVTTTAISYAVIRPFCLRLAAYAVLLVLFTTV